MSVKNILFFAVLFIAIPLSAQDNVQSNNLLFNFNSGDLGIGFNFPFNDEYTLEASASILSAGIEDSVTHLGIAMSPFKYVGWSGSDEYGDTVTRAGISLANFNLYWNAVTVDFSDVSLYFGPFTEVNYMFVGDTVEWDRYAFSGGAHFGIRLKAGRVNYNVFSVEAGYHNIDGNSKYFVGTKIDALLALAVFYYMRYDRAYR